MQKRFIRLGKAFFYISNLKFYKNHNYNFLLNPLESLILHQILASTLYE